MGIFFRHAPIGAAARYDDRFRCRVNFRQDLNALSFPTSWERIDNPVGELDLFQLAKSRCERDIAIAQRMDSYGSIRMRVVEFITATGRPPKLKELARQQGCSQRTIIRRLNAAGTNFQDLVDSIQMRRASEMLGASGASVEAAAERLGYSDASSFRRSFHRWFGVNPGEWRRRGRSPDLPAA
jgi:AraC-like DNA-binding protein